MFIDAYLQKVYNWFLTSGLQIILLLFLMLIILKINRIITKKLSMNLAENKDPEFQKRAETLSSIIRYIVSISTIIVFAIMILGELGVDIGPILATAGILGLAVGFGSQHLVQDIISGFFILLEDQIRVGDVVQISDNSGLVESINLRMTIIRDVAGNVHYIRNGKIDVVTNKTKEYSRYVFEIGVAYRENIDNVIEIIKAVDEEIRSNTEYKDDILEPIDILGLDKFADSAIIIKARIKTKPSKQWRVGRAYNHLLKKKFDEKDIEIPFPHVTLYLGQDKQGDAPAMNIMMKKTE
ncbi:mechanosensitive ion channel family protein [Candidatus Omnitrophota bacterium]